MMWGMAQRITTVLVDDVDGKTIKGGRGGTATFALDGVSYELELSDRNRNALDKTLAPYIAAARRVSGRRRGTNRTPARIDPAQARAIRDWAERNGHRVPARGRVPAAVVEAYNAAR